ncbi:MAG: four helix bundle protein [Bacteroidota bacterium]
MMNSFLHLDIWKRSRILVKSIYLISANFPKTEIYGLCAQMRRAAVSVPSNIAEGCGKRTAKDMRRYLDIAIGSLCELETQLYISHDLGFIPMETLKEFVNEVTQVRKMITGFQRKLEH